MTGSGQWQLGRRLATLLRAAFSLVAALALCASSEPLAFADERLSFSIDHHSLAGSVASSSAMDAEVPAAHSADGPEFSDPTAVDGADHEPKFPALSGGETWLCALPGGVVFVLANKSGRCGSRPRAPPVGSIG